MPTVQELKREIEAEQTALGVDAAFFKEWPWRTTYYRDNGEELPNLPGDPFNMRKYLDRGLRLMPPVIVETSEIIIPIEKKGDKPMPKKPVAKKSAKMPPKGMPPKGMHKMGDGSMMKNSDMPMMKGEYGKKGKKK